MKDELRRLLEYTAVDAQYDELDGIEVQVLALIESERSRLIDELEAKLPEVSAAQDNEFSNGYTLGFKAAIDDVKAILEDLKT
jgi:hypothetical protein